MLQALSCDSMTKHISDHCQKAMQQLRERQALKECLEGAEQGVQAAQDKLDQLMQVSNSNWNICWLVACHVASPPLSPHLLQGAGA